MEPSHLPHIILLPAQLLEVKLYTVVNHHPTLAILLQIKQFVKTFTKRIPSPIGLGS